MEKKQTRTAAKSPAKAKLKLRKVTVRDLETRKADEVRGGSRSVGQAALHVGLTAPLPRRNRGEETDPNGCQGTVRKRN